MAVEELNEAPSRPLFRAYMAMWGVAAIVALGYLGTLAWQPEQLAPAQPKVAEPEPGVRAAAVALAEVDTVRQVVDTPCRKTSATSRAASNSAAITTRRCSRGWQRSRNAWHHCRAA